MKEAQRDENTRMINTLWCYSCAAEHRQHTGCSMFWDLSLRVYLIPEEMSTCCALLPVSQVECEISEVWTQAKICSNIKMTDNCWQWRFLIWVIYCRQVPGMASRQGWHEHAHPTPPYIACLACILVSYHPLAGSEHPPTGAGCVASDILHTGSGRDPHFLCWARDAHLIQLVC